MPSLHQLSQLREYAAINSGLRATLEEFRTSLPLIQHLDKDVMNLRREVGQHYANEIQRHGDQNRKLEEVRKEVR